MKSTTLIKAVLSLSVLTPLVTFAAGNCEPQNTRISTAQRTAYIKQCLADSSSPANVKRIAEQQKKMSCEQNATNKALQGAARANYVSSCLNRNEAREAAEAMAASAPKKSHLASAESAYLAD
jgi:hypothetical protein